MAATRSEDTATPGPDDSALNTDGPTRSIRSSAAAMYERSTVGSLSRSSIVTQPDRGCRRAAHWDSSVVLP